LQGWNASSFPASRPALVCRGQEKEHVSTTDISLIGNAGYTVGLHGGM
jgi:hypothetical protein